MADVPSSPPGRPLFAQLLPLSSLSFFCPPLRHTGDIGMVRQIAAGLTPPMRPSPPVPSWVGADTLWGSPLPTPTLRLARGHCTGHHSPPWRSTSLYLFPLSSSPLQGPPAQKYLMVTGSGQVLFSPRPFVSDIDFMPRAPTFETQSSGSYNPKVLILQSQKRYLCFSAESGLLLK